MSSFIDWWNSRSEDDQPKWQQQFASAGWHARDAEVAELQALADSRGAHCVDMMTRLDLLTTENERLKLKMHDLEQDVLMVNNDNALLKSWQESVLADVGPEPMLLDLSSAEIATSNGNAMRALDAKRSVHYKHRAEHLAAKLVEIRALCAKASTVIADFANEAGDDHSVGVCNCADTDLADKLLAASQSQPAPLPGEQS